MDTKSKIIMVTGATGRQGGAVARHLVERGWHVRALTRDPDRPKAQALRDLGIEVFQGDLNTITSDHPIFKDVYGIFSVETFQEEGLEAEVRQGERLADIATLIGCQHFVYSSVGGADRETGIPHFETKWQIEQYIRKLNLPFTILRPVFFMDNFSSPDMQSRIQDGKLPLPINRDRPLQMIAVDDIGAFAAAAFEHPEEYQGKSFEIAGDELTMPQAAEIISQATGRIVEYVQIPMDDVRRSSPEMDKMFEWFNVAGYKADIYRLREIHPALMDFETWLYKEDWVKQLQEKEVAAEWGS